MTGRHTLTDLAMRFVLSLVAGLIATGFATAAGPSGSYRLTGDFGGDSFTALVSFAPQGNQWAGQFLGGIGFNPQLKPAVRDVRVAGDRLRFGLVLAGNQSMTFDGKLPAARGPIPGSLTAGESIMPVTLEPSALAQFDRTALLKEIAAAAPPGSLFYAATVDLLSNAAANKTSPEEVQALAERAAKAAEANGARWQMYILLRLTQALNGQPAFTAVALDLTRRAEKLLDPGDDVSIQLVVLDLLKRLLIQANDTAGVPPVQARIETLEARDYRDYVAATPIRPENYPGRKARSDRAVLFELFTNADDPPSLAAELAFDALGRMYKTPEVVRLQYHLHQPNAPDPLATRAADARWAYYQARLGGVAGVPTAFVNGRPGAPGGGNADVAGIKLKQYRALIDPQLDTAAAATLRLEASRDGDKVSITATVAGLAKPSDKVRLRIALAETVARYGGYNGVRYHQCVVRGFAGSPDGIPLPQPTAEHKATVDLAAVRAGLNAELDEYQKKNDGVLIVDRPLGLRSLIVVAFIQDDVTHEVLQAAQKDVK
jgi:hypothetical protein